MSKEMREQINKVKNFGQFLNEGKLKIEKFKIIKRMTPEEILGGEEHGNIGGSMVKYGKIYEIQLSNDSVVVSLMTDETSFNNALGENYLIVKSNGWWSSLADENVEVFTEKTGIKLKTRKIF
jgi:hypothetical protein